jgi:hypothetical protein
MTGPSVVAARPVVVHSLDHALAAAAAAVEAEVPLHLVSARGAASTAGPGWFSALGSIVAARFPGLPLALSLDCCGEAGLALGALRRGARSVIFTGASEAAMRLEEIARYRGATVATAYPDALDLAVARDPAAACARWFAQAQSLHHA